MHMYCTSGVTWGILHMSSEHLNCIMSHAFAIRNFTFFLRSFRGFELAESHPSDIPVDKLPVNYLHSINIITSFQKTCVFSYQNHMFNTGNSKQERSELGI
jgi:hypothetical protein